MVDLEGYVERISYRNEENGYTVLTLTAENGETVLTGIFPTVAEGEYIRAEGEMVVHPVYGEQLKVTSYEFIAPSDEASIERYLGSGAIKGIGSKLARRIVQLFGKDTFRILEEEPERLAEILEKMRFYRLAPAELILVHPYRDKDATMVLISGTRGGRNGLKCLPPVVIYREKNVYTEEWIRIYRE